MKVAIIGTRFPLFNYNEWLTMLLAQVNVDDITEVISGGALGIDEYARQFAYKHGLLLHEYFPDYKRFGRVAPLIRNTDIVEAADLVIAFPSVKSKGTYHTIDEAERLGKPIKIVNI